MFRILTRSAAKIAFFSITTIVVGRTLGSPESFINKNLADKVASFISGASNIESLYDAFFNIAFVIVVSITTVIYILTMKLLRIMRSK